jgi:hypothetical protein
MKRRDRVLAIALGLVLGVAIVTAFVFLGSDQTIDSPSLGGHAGGRPGQRTTPSEPCATTVQVIGGAPPTSGPAQLHCHQGDHVRIRIDSDAAVGVELLGYGIARTVEPGHPAEIDFTASKSGNFPLIVTASHIAVAEVRVGTPQAP